jgi:2-hydroxy-3-keto-5-methylthiopentenyl-1-phosphate phosphatase
MPKQSFQQNTIAMVYDFDGTLSPKSMQDYTLLPEFDIEEHKFWGEVETEVSASGADAMLVYMRILLEKARDKKIKIRREDYRQLAQRIEYFPGVEQWFDEINRCVRESGRDIQIKHYIISAGMHEILEGISIRKHFARIYASEYHFNSDGVADFPNRVINDTNKTQYLFRINKGKEEANQSINEHMNEAVRPIPFSNIVYIGDGLTDVPCMALTRRQGGHAIAVYRAEDRNGRKTCRTLLAAGRVDFIAEADYKSDSNLFRRAKLLLNAIMANIDYQRELFACKQAAGNNDPHSADPE